MTTIHFVLMGVVGTIVIVAFGTPAAMWLLNRIWPQTPEQLGMEKRIREARRQIDKFRY